MSQLKGFETFMKFFWYFLLEQFANGYQTPSYTVIFYLSYFDNSPYFRVISNPPFFWNYRGQERNLYWRLKVARKKDFEVVMLKEYFFPSNMTMCP